MSTKLNLGVFSKEVARKVTEQAKRGLVDPSAISLDARAESTHRARTPFEAAGEGPSAADWQTPNGTLAPDTRRGAAYGEKPSGAPVDGTSSKRDHLNREKFADYKQAASDTRTVIPGPKGGDFGGSDRMHNPDTTNYSFDFDWDDAGQCYKMKTANKTQHAAVDETGPLSDDDSCTDHLSRAVECLTDAMEAEAEDEADTRSHFLGKTMEHFAKAVKAHRRECRAHK